MIWVNWYNILYPTENPPVHTSDDLDIGDIDTVSRNFIVVKRGFVNVHYYYIPVTKVEGWDGHVLWLRITMNEAKANYERDKIPDPSQYYVKDHPSYTTTYYPELMTIPPRYIRPVFGIPFLPLHLKEKKKRNQYHQHKTCTNAAYAIRHLKRKMN